MHLVFALLAIISSDAWPLPCWASPLQGILLQLLCILKHYARMLSEPSVSSMYRPSVAPCVIEWRIKHRYWDRCCMSNATCCDTFHAILCTYYSQHARSLVRVPYWLFLVFICVCSYKKPTDLKRRNLNLLSVKPLYLHVELTSRMTWCSRPAWMLSCHFRTGRSI